MKAVRLVEVHRPLQMQEIPVPTIGDDDVLVRVRAAGICHTDVHYRAGKSPVRPLPRTLGHEVAGVVEQVGKQVTSVKVGDRVCVHYVLSCGNCFYCSAGNEQFCVRGSMVGRYADGGYAEYVAVPERNALHLPGEIPFEHGAVLMCSSSTAFHALRKSRLKSGETVAIFGVGGLGISAVQLAYAFGALDVYAVDINADKLGLAEKYGAVQSLAVMGRAVVAGISDKPFEINTYRELVAREAEVIGTSDHLLHELPLLLELTRRGKLDLSEAVTRTVPLDAGAINQVLDNLEHFRGDVRTVIVP